jgi:4-amino-4-deoxychorismate lyase
MSKLNSVNPSNQALINGQPSNSLSVFDRGLAYGDGVFRTLAVENGVPNHWPLQYQKLANDCRALQINCPSQALLLEDISLLFGMNEHAVAKIIITRGESVRGYSYSADIMPNRILIKSSLPQYPASNSLNGVKLHLCELRLSHQPKLAGIKHLNRLENVLARQEWSDATIAEGILLDVDGSVIEGTMSNVFARFGNILLSPDLSQCGVSGLARERIINNAHVLNLEAKVQKLSLDRLMRADEIIICNSLFGTWQAIDFNGKKWSKQLLSEKLSALLQQKELNHV